MKHVTLRANVDEQLCIGCKICERVCPVYAISVTDKKAHVKAEQCRGCANCADRCPRYAVKMVERDDPFDVGVDVSAFDAAQIQELCAKAHFHPEQVLCYCVGTRAEEVAAALLSGATTPEEISSMTGMRSIQPLLRLIQAAGHELHPNSDGYQWYGTTVTAWDIPQEVKDKYNARGFYFDEDRQLLDTIAQIDE